MDYRQSTTNEHYRQQSAIGVDEVPDTAAHDDSSSSNHHSSPKFRLDLDTSPQLPTKYPLQLSKQSEHFGKLHSHHDHYHSHMDLNYTEGVEQLTPPKIAYNCVFVPIFVAAWWYWTKRKARQVFARVGLLKENPERIRVPSTGATTSIRKGRDGTNNKNNINHQHQKFDTAKHEGINTCNSYDNYEEPEYSSWEEVVRAHDEAVGNDSSIRFVRWINQGAADYTDGHFFNGSLQSSSSWSTTSSVASVKQATKRTLYSTATACTSSPPKSSKKYSSYWRRHHACNLASNRSSISSTELLDKDHKTLQQQHNKWERLQFFPLFNTEMTNQEEEVNFVTGHSQSQTAEQLEAENDNKLEKEEDQKEMNVVSEVHNTDVPLSIQIS